MADGTNGGVGSMGHAAVAAREVEAPEVGVMRKEVLGHEAAIPSRFTRQIREPNVTEDEKDV